MKRQSAALPISGGGSQPDRRELAQLPPQTNTLRTIHIIAGTKMASMMEQFSERARAAGATFQTFDTLEAMARAIAERTHGKMVILVDTSLATNPKEIKQLSDARGERKTTVPMLLTRYTGREVLPQNVTNMQSTQESVRHFVSTVLDVLKTK